MPYLFQTALKLRNACTCYGIQVTAVAALEEVVGYAGYHGAVVAAEL